MKMRLFFSLKENLTKVKYGNQTGFISNNSPKKSYSLDAPPDLGQKILLLNLGGGGTLKLTTPSHTREPL